MRKWKIRRGSLLAALLVSAVWPGAAEAASITASLRPPDTRKPAPAFSLSDGSGKTVQLSDYRGKVVLLNFWATECGGCREEIPTFIELDQTYEKSGLAVVGISMDILYESLQNAQEAWSRVKPFVQEHRMKYPILMENDELSQRYHIEALPLTHLIDVNGRIAASYVGVVDRANIEANIKALLGKRGR